jgi:type I restriction enzyme M protein
MIDDLKAVCTSFGLGNASSEYKILTEVFLYKFLNDKFIYEARLVVPFFRGKTVAEIETALAEQSEADYELMLMDFSASTARLKQKHFISYLFSQKNTEGFHALFDATLLDIANYNIEIFSVQTGGQSRIRLFDALSQFVIEEEKRMILSRHH